MIYKVGDKVRLKPARKSSSRGYAAAAARVLTIKKIWPQYDWACSFEEYGDDCLFRLKDIKEVVS